VVSREVATRRVMLVGMEVPCLTPPPPRPTIRPIGSIDTAGTAGGACKCQALRH
jgi:hypothetical protein